MELKTEITLHLDELLDDDGWTITDKEFKELLANKILESMFEGYGRPRVELNPEIIDKALEKYLEKNVGRLFEDNINKYLRGIVKNLIDEEYYNFVKEHIGKNLEDYFSKGGKYK